MVSKVTAFAAVVLVVSTVGHADGDNITCYDVSMLIRGCIIYLQTDGGSAPPSVCCEGLSRMILLGETTTDRQTTCRCLRGMAIILAPEINLATAAALPQKCALKLPYPFSPSADCSKVQ